MVFYRCTNVLDSGVTQRLGIYPCECVSCTAVSQRSILFPFHQKRQGAETDEVSTKPRGIPFIEDSHGSLKHDLQNVFL